MAQRDHVAAVDLVDLQPEEIPGDLALLVFTFGYAAYEAARRAEPDSAKRQARSRRAFAASGQPRMAELATEIASPTNNNTFKTGLGWLLDGIAQATG